MLSQQNIAQKYLMARRTAALELEKPFGPYNLDDVLDGAAIPSLTPITHFKMKRDGKVTG